MRTKAKIVGIGERKSGISKKNRKYDFTPFHLIYADKNTEGFAAACTNVDQSILDAIPMPKDIIYSSSPLSVVYNDVGFDRIRYKNKYWQFTFNNEGVASGQSTNVAYGSGELLGDILDVTPCDPSSVKSNTTAVKLSDNISNLLNGDTYALWLGNALTLADTTTALPISLGDTITSTGSIAQTLAQSITKAPATAYEKTDDIVYVEVPDVSNDLSGIIALLQAILKVLNNIFQTCAVSIKTWINANAQAIIDANSGMLDASTAVSITNTQAIVDAISGIKFGDLSKVLTDVKTAVISGTTAITGTITDTIDDVIAKLAALGLTLSEILAAIQSLATTIAEAITAALTAVFVPSADFMTAKVEALRTRFDWINPFIDFVKSLSFSGAEPPIIYVDLGAAEGSLYWGGRVAFLDMTWYSRYKATGDAIISGFLWLLFGWRMYLKLPGIISGAGGTVGHITRYGG